MQVGLDTLSAKFVCAVVDDDVGDCILVVDQLLNALPCLAGLAVIAVVAAHVARPVKVPFSIPVHGPAELVGLSAKLHEGAPPKPARLPSPHSLCSGMVTLTRRHPQARQAMACLSTQYLLRSSGSLRARTTSSDSGRLTSPSHLIHTAGILSSLPELFATLRGFHSDLLTMTLLDAT